MDSQEFTQHIVSAIPALLGAIVGFFGAMLATAITQTSITRREKTGLLLRKLEELYLAVNQAGDENHQRYLLLKKFSVATDDNEKSQLIEQMETQGHFLPLQKKISMYVYLYFCELIEPYGKVMAEAKKAAVTTVMPSIDPTAAPKEFDEALNNYGGALATFSDEIISRRKELVSRAASRI